MVVAVIVLNLLKGGKKDVFPSPLGIECGSHVYVIIRDQIDSVYSSSLHDSTTTTALIIHSLTPTPTPTPYHPHLYRTVPPITHTQLLDLSAGRDRAGTRGVALGERTTAREVETQGKIRVRVYEYSVM